MKRVLLFSQQEGQIRSILREVCHVIPVSSPPEVREYLLLAEVLIVDATGFAGQIKDFLKEVLENRELVVVVYTEEEEVQGEEEFLSMGVSSVIKKGYSPDTVQRMVCQIIEGARVRRELKEVKVESTIKENLSREKETGIPAEYQYGLLLSAAREREALKRFSKVLAGKYAPGQLLDVFLDVLQEIIKVSRIAILLEDGGVYKIKAYRGILPKAVDHVSFPDGAGVIQYLKREGTVLRLGASRWEPLDTQVLREMRALGVVAAVPLWEQGRLAGIIVFNNKITGVPVTDSELELVFVLGSQMAVAIENVGLAEFISEQRNYLEGVLEHVNCGVVTVNKNAVVVTYNPGAEEILEVKRTEVLGKHISVLPGDVAGLLEGTLRTGAGCIQKELWLPGVSKFIGVSITPVKNKQGEITDSVMVLTDLSPVKALEEETRRLDQLNFTNTVAMRSSHELKNCLVSIKTFAQLLPERYMDKQFREDFYLVVNKEVDRLNQLVENLLFFAQPVQLERTSIDIEELAEEALAGLEKDDLLLGVEVVKEYGHRKDSVSVDREAMLRAVKALLYNSIQAMPKGGKIHITTACVSREKTTSARHKREEEEFLELKIVDQGMGIPPESIDRIWEPFFTTRTRGIGLGLTIVRKIVEAHGGRIAVSSQPQKGTEVVVSLPMASRVKYDEGLKEILQFPGGRKGSSGVVAH